MAKTKEVDIAMSDSYSRNPGMTVDDILKKFYSENSQWLLNSSLLMEELEKGNPKAMEKVKQDIAKILTDNGIEVSKENWRLNLDLNYATLMKTNPEALENIKRIYEDNCLTLATSENKIEARRQEFMRTYVR